MSSKAVWDEITDDLPIGIGEGQELGEGRGCPADDLAGAEHHHMVCRMCGSEIEVEHRLLESLYRSLEKTSGYRSIDSHVTFFGLCPQCQKKP